MDPEADIAVECFDCGRWIYGSADNLCPACAADGHDCLLCRRFVPGLELPYCPACGLAFARGF